MVDNVERWRRQRRSAEQRVERPEQEHYSDEHDSVHFSGGAVGDSLRGGVSVVETAAERRQIADDRGNRGDSVQRPGGVRRQDRRKIFAALPTTAAATATANRLPESDRVTPGSGSRRVRRNRARHNDPTKLWQTVFSVDRESRHSWSRELCVNSTYYVHIILI